MPNNGHSLILNPQTRFILSTSGSQTSLRKHNEALQKLNVNLSYFTFSYRIEAQVYANVLKSPLARGGAVTGQGLKSDILTYLDVIDKLSQTTNAVNTVINKNGKLYGYNTDGFGFEIAIKPCVQQTGIKTAIIYGNGGVSGVAAHVLQSLGIHVTMTGRNTDKVSAKMKLLGLGEFAGPYDLVVNATPVSSEKLEHAVGLLEILQNCKTVFDHNMPEKDGNPNYLQAYCDTNNIRFISGKNMYTTQMLKQWQLFLEGCEDGRSINEEQIKEHWDL